MSLWRILISEVSRFWPSISRTSFFTMVPAHGADTRPCRPTYNRSPFQTDVLAKTPAVQEPPANAPSIADPSENAMFTGVLEVAEKPLLGPDYSTPRQRPRASRERLPDASRPRRRRSPRGGRAAARDAVVPNLAHSSRRRSACETGLNRPVRPTSPNAARPSRTGAPRAAEATAEADAQVGARLLDPEAAGDVHEDVGLPECEPGMA